jgi:predicted AlkP superfamily pyrophosphatase or phosphodiesterase
VDSEDMEFLRTAQKGYATIKRALIIGVDGLGGPWVHPLPEHLKIPNIRKIQHNGAWSFHARAVMPAVSKPNWMTIISGAGPEEHGVFDNDWIVGGQLDSITGANKYFPTIYEVLKTTKRHNVASLTDWDGFNDLFPASHVDYLYTAPTNPNFINLTSHLVKEVIEPKNYSLMFVHYNGADMAGHDFGWGSPQYYGAIEAIDSEIGQVLDSLEDNGLSKETLIVITADHGGNDTDHGQPGCFELCYYTTLMFSGPSIKKNYSIPCPTKSESCYQDGGLNIRLIDISSTILNSFGIEQPGEWIGRVLSEIYH